MVTLGKLGLPVQLEIAVMSECLVKMEHQEQKEQLVIQVAQVSPEAQVQLGNRVALELWVPRVKWDRKAHLEIKDLLD